MSGGDDASVAAVLRGREHEFDEVLALYDRRFRDLKSSLAQAQPDFHIDVQNAASMLFRLERHGIPVGDRWTELADAALPDEVPAFRKAKELIARKAELTHGGGTVEEIRDVSKQLHELKRQSPFPLSDADSAALRASLQARILSQYEEERAAHTAIGAALGQAHY